MRIAIPYENGQVFPHFGHTTTFKFYEVVNDRVTKTSLVTTDGAGHGALVPFLCAHEVAAVICGGIGGGAQAALLAAGIRLYGGVTGDADAAVEAFAAGTLYYNPVATCDHHKGTGAGAHSCGAHGCGGHCKH